MRPRRGKGLARGPSARRQPDLDQDLAPSPAWGSALSTVFLASLEESDKARRRGQGCNVGTLVLTPALPGRRWVTLGAKQTSLELSLIVHRMKVSTWFFLFSSFLSYLSSDREKVAWLYGLLTEALGFGGS